MTGDGDGDGDGDDEIRISVTVLVVGSAILATDTPTRNAKTPRPIIHGSARLLIHLVSGCQYLPLRLPLLFRLVLEPQPESLPPGAQP
jgi:hypothetical protein